MDYEVDQTGTELVEKKGQTGISSSIMVSCGTVKITSGISGIRVW